MKSKKLLLAGVLAVLSVSTLVGCGGDKGEKPQDLVDRICAETNFAGLLKGINSDYDLYNELEGVSITYEVAADSKSYISISADNKTLVVNSPFIGDKIGDVTVGADWATPVKFTATFTYKGATATKDFAAKVISKAKVLSYDEFIAAKKDEPICLEVIIDKVALERKYNSYMVWSHDEAGHSYYMYKADKKLVNNDQLKAGNKVKVSGKKDIYNGLHQLTQPTTVEKLGTGSLLEAKDITADLTKVKDLKDASLVKYQGAPVIVTGLVLKETPKENGGKYFIDCTLGDKDFTAVATRGVDDPDGIKAAMAALKPNDILTITGWGEWYNQFQLTVMATDACKVTGTAEKTDAEKIAEVKEDLSKDLPGLVYTEAKLPKLKYEAATATYASSNEAALKVVDGKLVATPAAAEAKVTLTATVKLGTLTETVTKEVVVPAITTSTIKLARYSSKGADITVTGKVTAVQGNSFYIDDGESSLFVYNLSKNPYAVGDNVSITGKFDVYNGLNQVKPAKDNPVHAKLTDKDFTAREVLAVTAANFTASALAGEDGRMAKATDLEFVKEESKFASKENAGRYAFKMGDKTVKLTIDKFARNGEAIAEVLGALKAGDKIDVEANLGWYKGPQFDVTAATQITVK